MLSCSGGVECWERRRQAEAYRTFVERLECWVVPVALNVGSVDDKLKHIGPSLSAWNVELFLWC